MRVIDLFAGLHGWSRAFRERGHDVLTLDFDPRFGCDLTMDVLDATPETFRAFGRPDIVLASPPCNCFSVASIGAHWTGGRRAYEPKTEAARTAMRVLEHTVALIKELDPTFFVIENPRGVMRKMAALQGLERHTVTYCQYGENRMKPTDLWGGFPPGLEFRRCRNGDPCHEAAPRGAKTGTQGIKGAARRAEIPRRLALETCLAAEAALEGRDDLRRMGEEELRRAARP